MINYKRDGTIYKDINKFAKDFENEEKRIVKQEILPNGKFISTIWKGIDLVIDRVHRGRPLIFETMVFPREGIWREIDCDRYSTEEEALKGHKAMVEKWR